MKENLTKLTPLKKKELSLLFRTGKRLKGRGQALIFRENGLNESRFAVTLIRKYGNSVERNLVKRQMREIFRLNRHKLKKNIDLVYVVYLKGYSYRERENIFLSLLEQINER